MAGTGCRMHDAGYKMPDAKCRDRRTEKTFGVSLLGIEFINPEGLCSNPFYFFIAGSAPW